MVKQDDTVPSSIGCKEWKIFSEWELRHVQKPYCGSEGLPRLE